MNQTQTALGQLAQGSDLTAAQMEAAMLEIMQGQADPVQVGGLLMALAVKGETVTEIAAAARVMRLLATPVEIDRQGLTDIVGTGGDGAGLFNVSTASAFAAAACGVRVAKHGNRSVSSRSGAADVLEAAGCRLDLSADQVVRLIDEAGVGFLFAPQHHGAMKHAIGPRKALGLRTVFNLLGPLTNPAAAPRQVLGVFSDHWLEPMARVLAELGSEHVMVVHSKDGLDEISLAAPTRVAELKDGEIRTFWIEPESLGFKTGSLETLVVDDPMASLALVRSALSGNPGPAMDMVALNAGAACYVSGLSPSLEAGVRLAREGLLEGAGLAKLEYYAGQTRRV